MSIILGIDPGTTTVWFAILSCNKQKREILNYWIIETKPKEELLYKIFDIVNDLEWIIDEYKPSIVAMERLFFMKNVKTWMDVAHARWAMLYVLAKKWLKIVEYTPLQVKQWICWNWNANKDQVQKALKFLFKLDNIPKPDDAADALAIAYLASLNKISIN